MFALARSVAGGQPDVVCLYQDVIVAVEAAIRMSGEDPTSSYRVIAERGRLVLVAIRGRGEWMRPAPARGERP